MNVKQPDKLNNNNVLITIVSFFFFASVSAVFALVQVLGKKQSKWCCSAMGCGQY